MAASKTISDKSSATSYKTITLSKVNEVYVRGCVPWKMVGQDGVIVDIKGDYKEKPVNKIFYDNHRRKA